MKLKHMQLKTNILGPVHFKLLVYNVYVSSIATLTLLPSR